MSRLAELIEELCPDGVEYKQLSECVVLPSIPSGLKRKQYENSGSYPIVDQGREKIAGFTCDETKLVRDVPGIVFGDHTREIKYVDYVFVPGADGVKWIRAVDGVSIRYLFHCLTSLSIPSRGYNRHWILVREMLIPVPPLEVQREIVRILDQFTTLEAELEVELEAELEARRAQYEHYRNHLLSYDSLATCGPVDMVELGSVVTLLDSRRIPLKKGDRVSGEYPYYGASGIVDYVDSYIFDEDLLLVSEDGANLKARTKPIAFSTSGRVWVNNHAHVLKVESSFYQKFLEEYLNSLDLEPYLVGSTQPKLNQSGLLSIPVPLPTEQALERSVLLLEKLKLFVTDFSAGLPAEIAARRAQYEHYRDRLLSFPEKRVSDRESS